MRSSVGSRYVDLVSLLFISQMDIYLFKVFSISRTSSSGSLVILETISGDNPDWRASNQIISGRFCFARKLRVETMRDGVY